MRSLWRIQTPELRKKRPTAHFEADTKSFVVCWNDNAAIFSSMSKRVAEFGNG
jgi:hypothetical protein